MKKNKKNVVIDNKSKHSKVFLVFTYVLLFALVFRLGWLQFVQGSELKEMSYRQLTTNRVISPKRGTIYDTTGKALAISANVDTVTINPTRIVVKDDAEKTKALKEKVARAFSDIFGLDYEETLNKVNSDSSIETIAKKQEKDKIDQLQQWMKDNKVYSGINIDEDSKRYYPYNNLASSLLGFCGSDNDGVWGLEYYWNDSLTGTPGKILTSIDAVQDIIPDKDEKYVPAEDGSNLTLTIDLNIQTIVEKYLKQAVEENQCKNGGTMVLMDPTTGDILAMATYPDYNLNTPYEPNDSLKSIWETLSDSEKNSALSNMWTNKVIATAYEPGSVFKVLVASIALEENITKTDIANDFSCHGYENISGTKINCTKSHGAETLRNALENSCNSALMQLGKRIGGPTLYRYLEAYGLFHQTGIETSWEGYSQFHDLENVGPVELATTSFGQRFDVTPIQMITAVSAIANNGILMKPRIVKQVENTDTNVVTSIEPTQVRQVISKETAAKVRDMMQSVVTDGGGSYGQVKGYTIGGKTGTSEPDPNHPEDGYTSSFLAISPVENTKVVALLSLYGPQGKEYYGGKIAAPVVSQVLSEVLPYLGIPSNNVDDNGASTSTELISIPDVRNKTVAEAKNILQNAGFTCSISGNVDALVSDQVPKPGIQLSSGSIIKLYAEGNEARVSTTVPNLKGMSLSQARNSLKSINLNIQATGTGIIVSQDPAAATSVEEGSIIKVTLQPQASDLH